MTLFEIQETLVIMIHRSMHGNNSQQRQNSMDKYQDKDLSSMHFKYRVLIKSDKYFICT